MTAAASVIRLTHLSPIFPLNRNQSVDLQSKSSEKFIYDKIG